MRPDEHRLHPASVVFRFGRLIKDFGFLGLPILVAGRSLPIDQMVLVFMGVMLVPSIIGALLTYFTFRYRYEDDEFVVLSGLIFRNERHIPYSRIHNIDAVQNPLHRLFRVAMIRLETGSGTEADATLAAVPVAAIADMRRRMFERGAGSVVVAPEAADAAPVLLQLSGADALLAGFLLNRGYLIIAAVFGVVSELGPDDLVRRAFDSQIGQECERRAAGIASRPPVPRDQQRLHSASRWSWW